MTPSPVISKDISLLSVTLCVCCLIFFFQKSVHNCAKNFSRMFAWDFTFLWNRFVNEEQACAEPGSRIRYRHMTGLGAFEDSAWWRASFSPPSTVCPIINKAECSLVELCKLSALPRLNFYNCWPLNSDMASVIRHKLCPKDTWRMSKWQLSLIPLERNKK